MRLQAQLRRARNAEGRPLVSHEERILPHRLPPEPAELPRRWWPWLLGGVLVAAGAGWLAVRRPRLGGAFALVFWSLCSVLAALMLFIWLGTEHRFGWANRNLLVFSPVCLLLLAGAIAWIRGRVPGRWFRALLWVPVGTTVAAGFVYGLSRFPQQDLHWILGSASCPRCPGMGLGPAPVTPRRAPSCRGVGGQVATACNISPVM